MLHDVWQLVEEKFLHFVVHATGTTVCWVMWCFTEGMDFCRCFNLLAPWDLCLQVPFEKAVIPCNKLHLNHRLVTILSRYPEPIQFCLYFVEFKYRDMRWHIPKVIQMLRVQPTHKVQYIRVVVYETIDFVILRGILC